MCPRGPGTPRPPRGRRRRLQAPARRGPRPRPRPSAPGLLRRGLDGCGRLSGGVPRQSGPPRAANSSPAAAPARGGRPLSHPHSDILGASRSSACWLVGRPTRRRPGAPRPHGSSPRSRSRPSLGSPAAFARGDRPLLAPTFGPSRRGPAWGRIRPRGTRPSLPTGQASRSPRPQVQPEKLNRETSRLNQRAPWGRPDAPRARREAPSFPHGQGRPPTPESPGRALGFRDVPAAPQSSGPPPAPCAGSLKRPPGCLPAFFGEEKLAAPELSATGAEASDKPRPGGGSWAGQGGGGARGGGLRADQ